MRLAAVLLTTLVVHVYAQSALTVLSLARTIELGSIARAQTRLVASHDGKDSVLRLALTSEAARQLSWLEASEATSKQPLQITTGGGHHYAIHVPSALLHPGNVTLSVSETYAHASQARPKQLQQAGEAQLFMWSGDLLGGLGAGRAIPDFKVTIKAPTTNIQKWFKPEDVNAAHASGSSSVTFTGSSDGTADHVPASMHYEQPDPVVTFKTFNRNVQISHWAATVAVQDDIQLVNDGPRLKGFFSRVTHQQQGYMRTAGGYSHVIAGLVLNLPSGARNPYYVDTVGNVSTSGFRPVSSAVRPGRRPQSASLEIRPRYPLFGGWKYDFTIGYDLPLSSHLHKTNNDVYLLSVPFVMTNKDIAIDEATMKVILPEGASNVSIYPPFPSDPRHYRHKTYLDSTGRAAVMLSRRACTERHAVDVIISYRYTAPNLMQKPLAVALVMMLAFLGAIGLRRVRWEISSHVKQR